MSMSSSIALARLRSPTAQRMYEQGFTQKTKKKQTRSKQKKQTRKPKTKKQRKTKKQKNLEKSRFWFIFVFISLVILPICLFFCGEPVFDYVVNVFFVGCHFFATINLLCSRWPQNAKQQVHWFVIFAICSMKNMPVLHVSWMSVMLP